MLLMNRSIKTLKNQYFETAGHSDLVYVQKFKDAAVSLGLPL